MGEKYTYPFWKILRNGKTVDRKVFIQTEVGTYKQYYSEKMEVEKLSFIKISGMI